MSVLRCDGCFYDYPLGTFTVEGTEQFSPIIVPPDEVADDVAEGWTVTVHYHAEEMP